MPQGLPTRDQNYHVDGLPRSIKAKITELGEAAAEYAFIGAQDPEDHEAIEDHAHIARYNLERNIKTLLDRKDRQIKQMKKVLEQVEARDGRGAHYMICHDCNDSSKLAEEQLKKLEKMEKMEKKHG